MKTVHVHYFGELSNEAGMAEEDVDTIAATVGELYDELRTRHGFSMPLVDLKAAVNAQFRGQGGHVGDGDTVIFAPLIR